MQPLEVFVIITADGAGGFTILVDEVASTDGLVDITLREGRLHLTGQFTADGAPIDGEILFFSGAQEVGFYQGELDAYRVDEQPGDGGDEDAGPQVDRAAELRRDSFPVVKLDESSSGRWVGVSPAWR